MSEVKKWYIGVYGGDAQARPCSPAEFEIVHASEGRYFVLAEDFDNATRLFLDAAERCIASERREKELQQRLTAADEQNDLATDLLRRARAAIEGGGWADLERGIAKFLNPCKPVDKPHAVEDSHLFDTCRLIGGKFNLYAQLPGPFQYRVKPWMLECFGEVIAADRQERNHRFLEEALELVQACGCTATEAHQLVEYVFGRPAGEQSQEVGGVMVTLAALCLAAGLDMHAAAETELARIWTKVDQIRAKQAAKPAMSPLPGAYPDREYPAPVASAPDFKMIGTESMPPMEYDEP